MTNITDLSARFELSRVVAVVDTREARELVGSLGKTDHQANDK